MEPDWDTVADDVLGTTYSLAYIADKFDVDESDVEEELLDRDVECCPLCGWWTESGDLTDPDDDDAPLMCGECRE